jgi:subtilisin family serine protease
MHMWFHLRHARHLLLAAVVAFGSIVGGGQPGRAQGIAPGHVLVCIQPGEDIQKLAQDYHTTVAEQVPGMDLYSLALPGGAAEAAFATTLSADARVEYAEPDLIITSPEVFGEPFHFAFDLSIKPTVYANSIVYSQVNLTKVDTFAQTNASGVLATGSGTVVAVLDTGAALNHPALIGHFLPGYNAIYPALPPNDVPDGAANNEVGHGTMVAGIIARLAPQAQIMPVRVLNGDGAGTILNVVKGIQYAIANGAQVINMSFSSSVNSSALNDALDSAEIAGVVLVASAGNENVHIPGTIAAGRGILAVGAVEADNTKSPYSNYGSFIDVVAPGSGIRSTFWDGGYASWSGTSFAAPFVTAEAVLMLSNQPWLTSDVVITVIRKTARSVDGYNPAYKGLLGRGIIDVEAAVKTNFH